MLLLLHRVRVFQEILALTKRLTQVFVYCNRSDKREINEVRLNGSLKEHRNKSRSDKARTKLTEITLITPTSIHNNETKNQNKV